MNEKDAIDFGMRLKELCADYNLGDFSFIASTGPVIGGRVVLLGKVKPCGGSVVGVVHEFSKQLCEQGIKPVWEGAV